jgi:hypothetical protein
MQEDASRLEITVDTHNLYREESVTDLKAAAIRRLVPIRADGSPDPQRSTMFVGQTQLMTPHGPLPVQAPIPADTLEEALARFPQAMQTAVAQMIAEVRRLQREEASRIVMPSSAESSRIVLPGR